MFDAAIADWMKERSRTPQVLAVLSMICATTGGHSNAAFLGQVRPMGKRVLLILWEPI